MCGKPRYHCRHFPTSTEEFTGIFDTKIIEERQRKRKMNQYFTFQPRICVADHSRFHRSRVGFYSDQEDLAGMGKGYADTIYVVIAWGDGQSEFWAAAMPRHRAATEVRQFLPSGWIANFTGWRLPPQKSTGLKMLANSVRKLEQSQ
jgi:hypothetical protein